MTIALSHRIESQSDVEVRLQKSSSKVETHMMPHFHCPVRLLAESIGNPAALEVEPTD